MTFEAGPPRPTRRWAVRLFETSDKLEEHLNRSNLRPDQVVSITIDADGFFVLVYNVGGPPLAPERRPFNDFQDRPPPPRRQFDEDEGGGDGGFRARRGSFDRGGGFRGGGGGFDRGGGGGFDRGDRGGDRRDLPPRRTPRR